jgi:hypothetical protein
VLVRLDQPEIFSYPIAYLSEPGGWNMTDAELRGLRKYIERGGFIIFDDIEGEPNPDYRNLVAQWRRAFPGAVPIKLTNEHPIFDSFFRIDLSKIPSKVGRFAPEYLGFFEDNDPKKRMLAIIDNYADVGELIEWSDEGFDMVPATEAYKLVGELFHLCVDALKGPAMGGRRWAMVVKARLSFTILHRPSSIAPLRLLRRRRLARNDRNLLRHPCHLVRVLRHRAVDLVRPRLQRHRASVAD